MGPLRVRLQVVRGGGSWSVVIESAFGGEWIFTSRAYRDHVEAWTVGTEMAELLQVVFIDECHMEEAK